MMPHDDMNPPNLDKDRLIALDRRPLTEGASAYQQILHDNALIVVPGNTLGKRECIEAIAQSPPWERFSICQLWAFRTDDSGIVAYQFEGMRRQEGYRAVMTSTYVMTHDGPRLTLHQQTPDQA